MGNFTNTIGLIIECPPKSLSYLTYSIEVYPINHVSVKLIVNILFSSGFERISLSNTTNEYLGILGTTISFWLYKSPAIFAHYPMIRQQDIRLAMFNWHL